MFLHIKERNPHKPSLPSPWATTLGSVYSGRRPNSQLQKKGKHVKTKDRGEEGGIEPRSELSCRCTVYCIHRRVNLMSESLTQKVNIKIFNVDDVLTVSSKYDMTF